MGSDLIIAFMSTGMKLAAVIVALMCARVMLWHFDRASGFKFKEWINNADDFARAVYLTGRIVAVCIACGLAVS